MRGEAASKLLRVRDNESFVPIGITPSSITGAGYGVKALKRIEKNTVIAWYIGDIRSIN